MRHLVEHSSNILFLHGGVVGKISATTGKTTHLASWAYENSSDLLVYDFHLYVLAGNKVFKLDFADGNFGSIEWSATLAGTPLRLSITPEGYVQVFVAESGDLVSGLFNRTTGAPISYTTLIENVGDSIVLDIEGSAIVLGERTSATSLVVRLFGTASWESTFETFGEIQSENLTLRFIDNGQYILLGYNERTEEGGWDPRILMVSPITGSAIWTSNNIFSTRGSDTLSGVFSDPLSSDIHLIYSSESGLMNIALLNKPDGSTDYNLPIPTLSGIFPEPQVLSSTLDNNKLSILFRSSDFVNGLNNSHVGTHYGLVRFSVSEPAPANSVPTNITISEIPSFVFESNVSTYDLTIPNTSRAVSFSIMLELGQTSVVRINGNAINATSFYVPVGMTRFEIVVTAGSSSSIYFINIDRQTVVSGPTYVNMTTGNPVGRGTAQHPIKNLNQAMRLVNKSVMLRVRDFLPLSQDTSFEIKPVRTSAPISKLLDGNTIRMKNPDPTRIYALGLLPPLRGSIGGKDGILSFFIKIYDETLDQFVQEYSPMEFEFNLPTYYSRSSLRLYREESNGTTTEIAGGVSKLVNSLFSLTLGSNSIYTITDSDALIPSAGIGSDPHITTLFGDTYTLHKLSKYGNNLNILKTPYGHITGRVTGLANGEFLDSVEISVGGERVLSVKFGNTGSRIKVLDSLRAREIRGVNVRVDKFQTSSRANRVFFVRDLWEGGMYVFVNDQHRYVCPIPLSQPRTSQRDLFSGLLGGVRR